MKKNATLFISLFFVSNIFLITFFLNVLDVFAVLPATSTRCSLIAAKLSKDPNESGLPKSYKEILPQCKSLFPEKFKPSISSELTPSEEKKCDKINKLYLNKNRTLTSSTLCSSLSKCQQAGLTPYNGIKHQCGASAPLKLSPQGASSPQTQTFSITITSIIDTITKNNGGINQGNPMEVKISLTYPSADFIDWSSLKATIIQTTTQKQMDYSGFSEIGYERKEGKVTFYTSSMSPGVYTLKVSGCLIGSRQCKTTQQNFIICPKDGSCKGQPNESIDEKNSNEDEIIKMLKSKPKNTDFYDEKIDFNQVVLLFSEHSSKFQPQGIVLPTPGEGSGPVVQPVIWISSDQPSDSNAINRAKNFTINQLKSAQNIYSLNLGKGKTFAFSEPIIFRASYTRYYYEAEFPNSNIFPPETIGASLFGKDIFSVIAKETKGKLPLGDKSTAWLFLLDFDIKNYCRGHCVGTATLSKSPINGGYAAIAQEAAYIDYAAIIAHELGHIFGLEDRYPPYNTGGSIGGKYFPDIGQYSLMGYGGNGIFLVDEDKEILRKKWHLR